MAQSNLPSELIYPKVGIGVMVFKKGKVLLGLRKGSHGSGEYAWPGGSMEYLESFEECARREVREETGIEIKNVEFIRIMNLRSYPPKHFVDIALKAEWMSGEPEVMEPEKLDHWGWYEPVVEKLPRPLFATIPSYLEALKTGQTFWDG